MFPLRFLCLSVIAVTAISNAWSQATPAAPLPNPDVILRELAAIKTNLEQQRQQRLRQTATEVLRVSNSPSDARNLYLSAIKEVEFAGLTGEGGRFTERKKQLDDQMSTPVFREAITLHLKYLALTLDRALTLDQPVKFDQVWAYVRQAAEARYKFRQELAQNRLAAELLGRGVNQSVFEQVYRFGPDLREFPNWEMSPGNVVGILDKQIRPELRKNRDPRLIETWDLQIKFEQGLAVDDGRDMAVRNFEQVRLPALLWNKAQDVYAIGGTSEGMAMMLDIVRKYPTHPDLGPWVESLEAALQPVEVVAPAGEAEAAPAPVNEPAAAPAQPNDT